MTKNTLIAAVVKKLLTQMVAASILVILLLGATLSVRSIWVQSGTQNAAIDTLGQGTATALASLAQAPLDFDDRVALGLLLKEMRLVSSDMRYVLIAKSNGGAVLADPADTHLPAEALDAHRAAVYDLLQQDVPLRDFVATAKTSSDSFVVHVGIDRSRVLGDLAAMRTWNIILTVALALAAAVLVSLVARRIVLRVHDLGEHVSGSVQELRAAATEILAIAGQTETNSESQAASVDETRRTMQALIDAAVEIADGAANVVSAAERSSEASVVIAERIAKLNHQAAAITDLSESVRDIADKSDILALNASLEGAKAGDAGRGFVLLGAEMRRLAETTTDAVRRIKQLSTEIRDLSQSAVLASEEGQKLAGETTETAKRITLVTNQQRTATEQVKQAMNEVQQFSQQAVSGAKQARSTAGDLVSTAATLSNMLEQKTT